MYLLSTDSTRVVIFFLLTSLLCYSAFQLSILSEVRLLNFLRKYVWKNEHVSNVRNLLNSMPCCHDGPKAWGDKRDASQSGSTQTSIHNYWVYHSQSIWTILSFVFLVFIWFVCLDNIPFGWVSSTSAEATSSKYAWFAFKNKLEQSEIEAHLVDWPQTCNQQKLQVNIENSPWTS